MEIQRCNSLWTKCDAGDQKYVGNFWTGLSLQKSEQNNLVEAE